MRLLPRIGHLEGNERERTGDEICDRARCRDAATGERPHRFVAALKMHRRQHKRSSAECDAGSAVPNPLMHDVRRGVRDERNRGDRQKIRERKAL